MTQYLITYRWQPEDEGWWFGEEDLEEPPELIFTIHERLEGEKEGAHEQE